jgi:hypothetical protein
VSPTLKVATTLVMIARTVVVGITTIGCKRRAGLLLTAAPARPSVPRAFARHPRQGLGDVIPDKRSGGVDEGESPQNTDAVYATGR